jgi:GMP synthase (glutamine-hydrolysing)
MRSAVAIRHVAFEDAGLLAPLLAEAGWSITYCDAATDDLGAASIAQADLLIVLGGPIGVYEVDAYPFLAREIALLERRLRQNLPTLGICLGSQLMAKALGARVFAGPVKEIGWGTVTLTPAGRESCLAPLGAQRAKVLHWHGDTFDLPPGAVRLASSAAYENQAFAHGDRALALQFHLETEPRQLEAWYVGHTMELASVGMSVPTLRAATAAVAEEFRAQARRVFGAWLAQL